MIIINIEMKYRLAVPRHVTKVENAKKSPL